MSTRAFVIDTGAANTASVMASLRRLDLDAQLVENAGQIESAEFIVLPGVGAFANAMSRLTEAGYCDAIRARIEADRPTLAICLGLQLLCASSEESEGVEGLGLLPSRIRRFERDQPVPQLGWNEVRPDSECKLLQPGWADFANSYYLDRAPIGWNAATTDYGITFVSAVERGNVLACQFHPELSSDWGQALISRWIQAGLEA